MQSKTRYAIVGTGIRSCMFRDAIVNTYASTSELVALCDNNPLRMAAWQSDSRLSLPTFAPTDFERMIATHRIDTVIVTSIDRTHDEYICRALEAGCDVVTEKPMTTDPVRCRRILETQARTGRQIKVAFNYRYAPRNSKIKEIIQSGILGTITSVNFEWLLDTRHGADYFRRWHRDKRNSGGLLVHKSTHHFDLVNWWLETTPETVMAMGDLRFYGRANAEARGVPAGYSRCSEVAGTINDPFVIDMTKQPEIKRLYFDCESADGYIRDQNVFGDGISIEDDISVLVRYRNHAVMTYHLCAFSPWEGYRVAFTGTNGRLELDVTETPFVRADETDRHMAKNLLGSSRHDILEPTTLLWRPHWGPPEKIDLPESTDGGHGGADTIMLADIFAPAKTADPLGRAASHESGVTSILTGMAANRSLETDAPVRVRDLLAF